MNQKRGLTSATGAMHAFLQSHELAKALRPHMAKVVWADVVGPQVAGVTQVEKVQNGTELVIRVKNSVWANELVLLKGDMLHRLNKALGAPVLTDLHFKASGLSRKTAPKALPEAPLLPSDLDLAHVALPPQAHLRIETTVRGITDDTLRDRMHATLLRAARLEQWKRDQGWQPCPRCGALTRPSAAPEALEALQCALCHAGAL